MQLFTSGYGGKKMRKFSSRVYHDEVNHPDSFRQVSVTSEKQRKSLQNEISKYERLTRKKRELGTTQENISDTTKTLLKGSGLALGAAAVVGVGIALQVAPFIAAGTMVAAATGGVAIFKGPVALIARETRKGLISLRLRRVEKKIEKQSGRQVFDKKSKKDKTQKTEQKKKNTSVAQQLMPKAKQEQKVVEPAVVYKMTKVYNR